MFSQQLLPSSCCGQRTSVSAQRSVPPSSINASSRAHGNSRACHQRQSRSSVSIYAHASQQDDGNQPSSSSSSSAGRQIASQAVNASMAGVSVTAALGTLLTSFGGNGGSGSGGDGGDGGRNWGSGGSQGPLYDTADAVQADEDDDDTDALSELPTEEQKAPETEHGVDGKELITSEYPEELWEEAGPDNRIGNKKCVEIVVEGWPEAGALPRLVSCCAVEGSATPLPMRVAVPNIAAVK